MPCRAERVLASMETGSMVTMANNRTAAERRAIAEFLTGKSLVDAARDDAGAEGDVPGDVGRLQPRPAGRSGPAGAGTRRTPGFRRTPGLAARDVPRLKLKWAFAFPGDLQSYSQATLAGGRLFVGSWGGKVYSLNASTGCIHWFFQAAEGVRSAVSVGRIDVERQAEGRGVLR